MIDNIAIILAAGKGTRMNDDSTNKVCFEVAGIPVIKRIVSNFRKAGVNNFVIVVGFHAEKVMECLADEEGIVYAFQSVQNGTGGAALCGLNAAKALGYSGSAVISVGDKIISPDKIAELLSIKKSKKVNAVWGAQVRSLNESGGRIVVRDGKIYGVVEQPDSALLALGNIGKRDDGIYLSTLKSFGLSEKKAYKVIQKAISMENIPRTIDLCGTLFDSAEIEKSEYTNASLYCFDVDEAIKAIGSINKPNAQGEIYLTDTLEYFVKQNSVELLVLDSRDQMVTYSTQEDLRELNRFFMFRDLEYASERLKDSRFAKYKSLIEQFIVKYGNEKILVTSAPGRVNLMGRHIDHQGGSTNVMCIDRETVMVVAPRTDDIVRISNADSQFEDFSFSIGSCIGLSDVRDSWVGFIESPAVLASVSENKGKWVNYIKAAVLRLQFETAQPLLGMDIFVSGNIPRAAGVSSSSSLVVATAEAVVSINHLEIDSARFVDLCGEGEWFVGSRGGAADHGAMKCCQEGKITHMLFKPMTIGPSARFSSDYRIVLANSFMSAKKSEGAKDKFNQKVACYAFGFMMLKTIFPQYSEKVQHLRDYIRLGLSDIELYKMVLSLPERITSEALHALLPQFTERIDEIQKHHKKPEYYEVRGVVMYGLAECLRSERAFKAIEEGNYRLLGKMMNISHDGDRVYLDGQPYLYDVSDKHIRGLIRNLTEETNVEESRLENQPGCYACSIPEIDFIVDTALGCDGVLGAEISGAGLGGCVIILVSKDSVDSLISALDEKYYKPRNLGCGAQACIPSVGSQVIK